jgi:hypothetical protein
MRTILLTLATCVLLTSSCKKKEDPAPAPQPVSTPAPDVTNPVLTLKGNKNDTIAIGGTYTDPGATATDDVDGDITSRIVVTGTVDNTREGGNPIYYKVSDAAGNFVLVTRLITVRNDAYGFIGTYNTLSDCGGNFNGLTAVVTVTTSNSVNNKIIISSQQFQSQGFGVAATITGTSVQMYTQPIGSSLGSATGTVSADRKSFTLTTVYSPPIQGSAGCTIIYTRQ